MKRLQTGLAAAAPGTGVFQNRPHPSWVIGAALALGVVAVATQVQAVEPNRGRITILSPAQLQNLNNRERRLDFQQRQEIYREQDSRIKVSPQRPEVPVMKPRCPLQTSGTARTC